MNTDDTEGQPKWQPVMLVKRDRLECACGTLAIFIVLDEEIVADGKRDFDYTAWCQACYAQAQRPVEE